jgi:hypothetical protein
MSTERGEATDSLIQSVVDASSSYGQRSIIALAGVPGTGKSYIAQIAAQRIASDPLMVTEIQFHPSYSYEEFIEGFRASPTGGFTVTPGTFLEVNYRANNDRDNTYVLLIEEFTRSNLPGVLGELLTYIEYRDKPFRPMYSKAPTMIAPNLCILATFNPRDRSALEMDDALFRRLRILDFPPSTVQLREMLKGRDLPARVVAALCALFDACKEKCVSENRPEDYTRLMPFGHGVFADIVREKPDLHHLWAQRLLHLIKPPGRQPHPFYDVIASHYPWRSSADHGISEDTSRKTES